MIFTNDKAHGGTFLAQFINRLKNAKKVIVATGYFGTDLIQRIESDLFAVSKSGECRILLGMVFHGGISSKQKKCIDDLDLKLRSSNPKNGIYISRRDYHGKIYKIDDDIYVGSSNFSKEGFDSRLECTARINDRFTADATSAYLEYLFSLKTTEKLSGVKLSKKSRLEDDRQSKLLADYKVLAPPPKTIIGSVAIKLRVDSQPKSSLNLFFDEGRKNRKTGLYAPRPWYEIEITTTSQERRNPYYPQSTLIPDSKCSHYGVFDAYIVEDSNYYKLKMTVASAYGKALATSIDGGGRQTLGRYIKGKLEAAGVLKHGERITSQTLEAYGRDYITLQKIGNQEYIMEF